MNNQQNCPNCGFRRDPGDRFCKNCGKPFEEPAPPPTPPGGPTPGPPPSPDQLAEGKYVAFEDRQKIGFFESLWRTWKESVFYPDKFFSRLPFTGGLGSPLLYAVILAWIGFAFSRIYQMIFSSLWVGLVSEFVPDSTALMFGTGLGFGIMLIEIILAPVMIILGLFVVAGIYHLIFMIFGWAKRSFEATFRAVAYSCGPYIFLAVPLCGGLVGFIWSIVLIIIGFKHMQQTTGGKAALVYFLPLIVCFCFMLILSLIFGAAILALIGSAARGELGD